MNTRIENAITELQAAIDDALGDDTIASRRHMQAWISVNDRLPENSDDVLIYRSHKTTAEVGYFIGGWNSWHRGDGLLGVDDVLYWMPFPVHLPNDRFIG